MEQGKRKALPPCMSDGHGRRRVPPPSEATRRPPPFRLVPPPLARCCFLSPPCFSPRNGGIGDLADCGERCGAGDASSEAADADKGRD